MADNDVREQVRERYARAATAVAQNQQNALTVLDEPCCSSASCGTDEVEVAFGSGLYSADEHGELPAEAIAASLGCGNPIAVADLRAGEKVLDLGSGGGIDVLLSARRVGPTGFAYGVDMTDEMLALAETNKAKSGLTNVAFLKGTIEAVPLPDESVNVVISNCVINLSTDKSARAGRDVPSPHARAGASASRTWWPKTTSPLTCGPSAAPTSAASLAPCPSPSTSTASATAGFTNATVTYTHEVAEGHARGHRERNEAERLLRSEPTGELLRAVGQGIVLRHREPATPLEPAAASDP